MWGFENFDNGLYDEVESDYKWNSIENDPNYEPELKTTMSEEEAVEDWFKNQIGRAHV